MRLLVETGLPLAGGVIGAGGEVSWPKPTRPGDSLAVTSEIEEITPSRSRPDRGTVGAQRNPKLARRNRPSPSRQTDCAASRCRAVVARG
jgi:acyl dehydratase